VNILGGIILSDLCLPPKNKIEMKILIFS